MNRSLLKQIVIVVLVCVNLSAFSNSIKNTDTKIEQELISVTDSVFSTESIEDIPFHEMNILLGKMYVPAKEKPSVLKRKIIAVTLAVTLGVFGVHRLYLGTSTRVPIIYTLTLGGGFGVLVVSDIIAIIATKDLSQFEFEPKVFMWAK